MIKKAVKKVKEKIEDLSKVEVAQPVEAKPFVKGPHHIVKDGEVILDPKFVNPGVFSS